ncbi:MAG: hypothetical protein RLY58_1601 [Pseudomonadota bacterium]|jgi:hypothetical protein
MNPDARWIAPRLHNIGSCSIPLTDWNDALHQDVLALLPESRRRGLIIEIDEARGWVQLTLPEPDPLPPSPADVYPERSFWRKFLPLAVMGVLYFVGCYLTGDGLNRLVSASFLVGSPLVLGALLAYAMNYERPVEFGRLALGVLVLMAVCIVISVLFLKEGVICVIMASPILYAAILLGAALMHGLCRLAWKPHKAVYSIALLPLLWMAAPEQRSDYFGVAQQSTVIDATPAQIWQQLNRAEQIKPHEVQDAWAYKIGVPYPVSGVTVQTAEGLVRHSTWQKGIHFDEIIQDWQPNRLVRWTYRFGANSVPKGALDDHVTIGGQHFDLLDTTYRLTSISPTQTRLQITVRYRVSTDFNAYTGRWADALIGNFSSVILNFYKVRSEATAS